MVAIAAARKVNGNDVKVLAKMDCDCIPPVGVRCMPMHEQHCGFIGLVPTKVVDGGTLDLGEVARGLMVMNVSDHKSRS